LALRLTDNFWDVEGLALAFGGGGDAMCRGDGGGGVGRARSGASSSSARAATPVTTPETARRHDAKQVRVATTQLLSVYG